MYFNVQLQLCVMKRLIHFTGYETLEKMATFYYTYRTK